MVKPSMVTSLAVTSKVSPLVPVASTINSEAERVRASTPCWAPSRVSDLLTVTLSLYVPASARMTSPGLAALTASWIVA